MRGALVHSGTLTCCWSQEILDSDKACPWFCAREAICNWPKRVRLELSCSPSYLCRKITVRNSSPMAPTCEEHSTSQLSMWIVNRGVVVFIDEGPWVLLLFCGGFAWYVEFHVITRWGSPHSKVKTWTGFPLCQITYPRWKCWTWICRHILQGNVREEVIACEHMHQHDTRLDH